MKMRKLIALICALAMVLGIMAACSTPTTEPTPSTEPTATVEPTIEPTIEPTVEPTEAPTEAPVETPTPTPESTPYPTLENTVLTSDKSTWPAQDPAVIDFEQPTEGEYADWATKDGTAGKLVGIDHDKKECWVGTVVLAEGTDPSSIEHLIIPDTVEINGEAYTVVGLAWDLMGQYEYGGGVGFGKPGNPKEMALDLEALYIPKTVRYIDYNILLNWLGLEEIIFEDSSTLEYIGFCAFNGTPYEQKACESSETQMHIIGDNLVFVGNAFDVQIPYGVKAIWGRIFNEQTQLGEEFYRELIETITIPETVEFIDGKAFWHLDEAFATAEFRFRVKEGSYADTWLKNNGFGHIVEYFE